MKMSRSERWHGARVIIGLFVALGGFLVATRIARLLFPEYSVYFALADLTLLLSPFAMGALVAWAWATAVIRSPTSVAIAAVFGIPAMLYLFGPVYGLIAIGVSLLWWLVSGIIGKYWYARRLARDAATRTPTPESLAWGPPK